MIRERGTEHFPRQHRSHEVAGGSKKQNRPTACPLIILSPPPPYAFLPRPLATLPSQCIMPPPKRPLKPHIRRQIRQTALLANPIRDPSQDFSITGYEADLIKGRKTEEVLMREKEGMVEWDGVKPLGMEGQIRVDRCDINFFFPFGYFEEWAD